MRIPRGRQDKIRYILIKETMMRHGKESAYPAAWGRGKSQTNRTDRLEINIRKRIADGFKHAADQIDGINGIDDV